MSQTNWAVFIPPQVGIVSYAEGDSGVAKSAIISGLAKQSGRRYLPCYLESMLPEDIGGVPVPRTIKIGDRDHECVVRLLDEIFLRAKVEASIILLDEMNQASHSMMAAIQEWINPPPANAWVFAAGNPVGVATNGVEFSAPVVNRMCVVEWEFPTEDFLTGLGNGLKFSTPSFPIVPEDYFETSGLFWSKVMKDFLSHYPMLVHKRPEDPGQAAKPWPSPRSWTNVVKLLAAADSVGADAGTRWALIKGCVGEAAADQFQRFVTSLQLPDPEELLAMPHTLKLPPRFDLALAIVSSVVGRVKANCTPLRWEAAYDVLERAFEQQPETATAREGALFKLQPAGYLPKPRNGVAAEMRKLRIGSA